MHIWFVLALTTLLAQQPNPESRIVEYLKDSLEQGRRVEVSDLVNDVFTTPEERAAISRLYDTFFKIPMFLVQYQSNSNVIPSLQQISDQFAFNSPDTADVILQLMEADPRIPRFFERDVNGEITRISVEPVLQHPQFGQAIERSIAGWEGQTIPDFITETFDGSMVTSEDFTNKPYMLYIWFSNCPPCIQTGPLLVELYEEYRNSGFDILAANADRFLELPYDDQMRAEYVMRLGMEFKLAYLTSEMHAAYGGISIFPTMFFVDREGTILRHFVNFQEKEILSEAIESILE